MPTTEMKILMTLSHCVVVRTFLAGGVSSAVGVSADGGPAAAAPSAFSAGFLQ